MEITLEERAKRLAFNIIGLIRSGTVAEQLPGIIEQIPEAVRREVINTRFNYEKSFEHLIGASCLYIATDSVGEYINGRPYASRFDATFARRAVEILLANGADPNIEAPTSNGHRTIKELSILGNACYHGDFPIAAMLLDAGADVNFAREADNVMTVLLDSRSGQSISNISQGAEDGVNEIIQLVYQRGFNICTTPILEDDRSRIIRGIGSMFERATQVLDGDEGPKAQIALPLILINCYRDLTIARVRGRRRPLPVELYANRYYDNVSDLLLEMRDLYNDLVNPERREQAINATHARIQIIMQEQAQLLARELAPVHARQGQIIGQIRRREEQEDEEDRRTRRRTRRQMQEEEEENKYVAIHDNMPTTFTDPLTTEDDLDEVACKERGFIAAMKSGDGYIYECISKQNLAFWNSGSKKSTSSKIMNIGFNGGQFRVIKPHWIKNQSRLFNDIAVANASALTIPDPKIFLIEDAEDNKKKLSKAVFASEAELRNAWVRVPNNEKQDPTEQDFWYFNEITKESQWDPPYENAGGKKNKKSRSKKTRKNKRKR